VRERGQRSVPLFGPDASRLDRAFNPHRSADLRPLRRGRHANRTTRGKFGAASWINARRSVAMVAAQEKISPCVQPLGAFSSQTSPTPIQPAVRRRRWAFYRQAFEQYARPRGPGRKSSPHSRHPAGVSYRSQRCAASALAWSPRRRVWQAPQMQLSSWRTATNGTLPADPGVTARVPVKIGDCGVAGRAPPKKAPL
jgi:hypothetical protein